MAAVRVLVQWSKAVNREQKPAECVCVYVCVCTYMLAFPGLACQLKIQIALFSTVNSWTITKSSYFLESFFVAECCNNSPIQMFTFEPRQKNVSSFQCTKQHELLHETERAVSDVLLTSVWKVLGCFFFFFNLQKFVAPMDWN